jgi:4-amino-4-deoxy-L-arabinose transferase-like glycosyltransferase
MLFCAFAALFPRIALLPIQVDVLSARSPKTVVQVAQILFGVGALVFGCVFVAWHWLCGSVAYSVKWIVSLPGFKFWILVFGSASLLRLMLACLPREKLMDDAGWYYDAAVSLSMGKGLEVGGMATAYRAPGYPFLLSLTHRLFGPNPDLSWFWGTISTAIIILATHYIARRLYGTAAAKLATLAIATYPALALLTGQTMSDVAFLAGLMLLIWFVLSGSPYRYLNAVIIGATIGLLTLTRGVATGLFAVIPMVWYVRGAGVKKITITSLILFVTFAGSLCPWVLRNYTVFGVPTLQTNLGWNAYIGNHQGASGGHHSGDVPPFILQATRTFNEATIDRAFLIVAVKFIFSHPTEAARLIPKKLLHLYLLEATAAGSLFQGEQVYPLWEKYGLYGIFELCYLPLLLLFCYRVFDVLSIANRPRGVQWTGWLFTLYFTFVSLVFFGNDRYRLPILPWMVIESSVVLLQMTRKSS